MNLIDVCSVPVVLPASRTVIEAAKLMRDRHIGTVVVLGDSPPVRPVGIITDRDIVLKVVAPGRPHALVSVGEAMSTNPVTTPGSTGVYEALELMLKRGVRRLLVTGLEGELKGIVALDDLLPAIAQELGTMARTIAVELLHEENRDPGQ